MTAAAVCLAPTLYAANTAAWLLPPNAPPSACVAINYRERSGNECVRYQPLDGVSPVMTCVMGAYGRGIYGMPVPHRWRAPKVVLTCRRLDPEPGWSDILQLDYLQPSQAEMHTRPLWALPIAHTATHGPSIGVTDRHMMLPMDDDRYHVCDTVTGAVSVTSLDFGSDHVNRGRFVVAAHDYSSDGIAYLSGTGTCMTRYCGYTDTALDMLQPIAHPQNRITTLLCKPDTSTIVAGIGSLMHIYDFRVALVPVQTVSTRYPLWNTACFIGEHAIASWNSLHLRADRTWQWETHCQTCDLRVPSMWLDAPQWNLPEGAAPLWTSALDSMPRTM